MVKYYNMSKADMSFPLVKVYTSKKLPPPIYKKFKFHYVCVNW
jgi:hypothetical protein